MRARQEGFTLIEIIVSLAIFLMIVVGSLGVLGASNSGLVGGFPTALGAGRSARDITAASVYLQAFQEFVAGVGNAQMGTPNVYNCTPGGASWSCSPSLPASLSSAPQPVTAPYELAWSQMNITTERWYWNGTAYANGAPVTTDSLMRVRSTLTWSLGATVRTLTVERFIP